MLKEALFLSLSITLSLYLLRPVKNLKYKNIIYCSVSVFLIYLILLNLAPKIFGSFQQGLGFGLGARHVGFLENFSESNEPPSDFGSEQVSSESPPEISNEEVSSEPTKEILNEIIPSETLSETPSVISTEKETENSIANEVVGTQPSSLNSVENVDLKDMLEPSQNNMSIEERLHDIKSSRLTKPAIKSSVENISNVCKHLNSLDMLHNSKTGLIMDPSDCIKHIMTRVYGRTFSNKNDPKMNNIENFQTISNDIPNVLDKEVNPVTSYILGNFFIKKFSCLKQSQDNYDINKCFKDYLLELENDRTFIKLGKAFTGVSENDYKQQYKEYVINKIPEYYSNRVKNLCDALNKNISNIFSTTNKCIDDIMLLVGREPGSDNKNPNNNLENIVFRLSLSDPKSYACLIRATTQTEILNCLVKSFKEMFKKDKFINQLAYTADVSREDAVVKANVIADTLEIAKPDDIADIFSKPFSQLKRHIDGGYQGKTATVPDETSSDPASEPQAPSLFMDDALDKRTPSIKSISRDTWLKDEGLCHMAEMKLMRKDGQLVLNWKRKR